MTLFKDMNLSSQMQMALEENKFVEPTPIQEKTIPLAMSGVDIMGSAQTGTGKTLSFVIPMLEHLYNNKKGMGLILAPTRELAQQVDMAIRKLIQRGSGLRTALIIGGEPYPKQMSQLRANPRIIVGTPGRIIDHLERGSLTTAAVSFLVLDETDRMFDMGFGVQLEEIISTLSEKRQTLMFSATFPKKIQKLAEKYMQKPQRISVESKETLSLNLVQETRQVKESQKYEMLVNELHERKGSVIVFVKTKSSAEKIANDLCKQNFDATAIHGDLRQSKRERVMGAFRKGRYRIMVATDVAARGIDVPHIEHVINYNLPQAPEDFIHRVGRTARAGAEGSALNLISGDERRQWSVIQRMLDPTVAEEDKEFGWKSDRKPGRKGGGGRNQGANNNRFGKSKRDFSSPKKDFSTPSHRKSQAADSSRRKSHEDFYTLEDFERSEKKERSPKKRDIDYSKPQGKAPFAKRKSMERKNSGGAFKEKSSKGEGRFSEGRSSSEGRFADKAPASRGEGRFSERRSSSESRFMDKAPARKKPRAGSQRKSLKASS